MTCETVRALLDPYADGELDLMRSLEVEEHLNGCERCAGEAAMLTALRTAIGEAAQFHAAPAELAARVRALASTTSPPGPSHAARVLRLPPFGWGLAAALAALLAVVWLKGIPVVPSGPDLLAREVVADHVRSLMAAHLTDVISSSQHTVKPWFEGRLDFSPTVEDLTAQGYALIGGRLDILHDRPVAAIVYKRRAHVINLFIWPLPGAADTAETLATRDGYNLVHWTRAGMAYWAVSSLNASELREFAADLAETAARPAPLPAAH